MNSIIIGTFNLRNHYWDKNWDGEEEAHILAQYILINKIDYLGVQELVKKYCFNLQKELGTNYKIIGNYRFGKFPIINRINEANAIITNKNIAYEETRYLARIPYLSHNSSLPRIFTVIENDEIFLINTHLDYQSDKAQRYQLNVLYKYIFKNINKNPIIMGDFNMVQTKDYFQKFITSLKKLDINLIPNNVATFKTKEKIIDYIFLPNCYELLDFKIVTNAEVSTISDHYPLIAKIRRKN